MDDFPLLILFFIFYLIAGSSGKKKKKKTGSKARQQSMRTRAQGEQRDMRALERERQTMAGFGAAFASKPEKNTAACEEGRIHLHEVSQTQLRDAAEGEDPCHAGGERIQTADAADTAWSETDETQEAPRQDMLRGVIMSEILTRPQQRRALQRSRREYHGY